MTKTLLIEDDPVFAHALQRCLEKEKLAVELASNFEEGLASARTREFEVVVSDLYLGKETALDLIAPLQTADPELPVIIMTADHTTDTAIEVTKRGAYDYFPKLDESIVNDAGSDSNRPWVEELARMVKRAAESRKLTAEVRLEYSPEATTSPP